MKSSPPMCPTKPVRAEHAFHHVVQDPGQQVDDPVAVVVGVAVVELLEVIEIRVADSKFLARLQVPADLPLDLGGARHPGAGMHGHVALGAHQHRIEAGPLLGRGEDGGQDLVGPGGKPVLHGDRIVGALEHRDRDDGAERISLEPGNERPGLRAHSFAIDEEQAWVAPEDDRLDLVPAGQDDERKALVFRPAAHEVGYGRIDRPEIENGRSGSGTRGVSS